MKFKKLYTLFLFLLMPIGGQGFEESAIIYNSTVAAEQKIALGIRKEGQMGARKNNIARNASYTGIAYKFDGSRSQGSVSGWNDATTPGCLCEGWGAGFVDRVGRRSHGRANQSVGRVSNIEVKSFVSDATSITSTVWIKDSVGQPVLEVTHRFGPAAKVPGALFQALVTMTNISGETLQDVRYNRTMDWDIPLSEFSERVTIEGVEASAASADTPKVLNSGNNGFMRPDPFGYRSGHAKWPKSGQINKDYERAGPADHGFTATFGFGELLCGEAHTFMIYYGAAANKSDMEAAFATEGVPLYSIGESNPRYIRRYYSGRDRATYGSEVAYGFGFKGVSGSAIAPSLPTKTAILPGGIETDESIVQTYAPPVIYGNSIYQAIFKFRKDKQWEGNILRYPLAGDGSILSSSSTTGLTRSAKYKLKNALLRGALERDTPFTAGNGKSGVFKRAATGRSIWTVGNDPDCGGLLTKPSDNNNFIKANIDQLEQFLFSCSPPPSGSYGYVGGDLATMLVRFVRGADIHYEDPLGGPGWQRPRIGLLGDTFHSELVFVGPPSERTSSDIENFGKSESYFRYVKGYAEFSMKNKSRRPQLYVGANDGMLHAFDEDLNERWAFVPPSVLPNLRDMLGVFSTTNGRGKSNSVFNVDGPIIVKDIYIHATKEWKTVLVGGLGYGGKSYYVLDITDPDDPQHMFTISNNDTNKTVNYWAADGTKSSYPYLSAPEHINYQKLGDTWSRPSIMLLPYQSTDGKIKQRWTMVFGGGYGGGASSGFGPYVFVLDFEPDTTLSPNTAGGKIISAKAITPDPSSDIPNGVTADMSVITSDNTSMADYYGGIAYFTDLQGQLWKYNLSKTSLDDGNDNLFELNLAYRAEGTLANGRYGFNQVATTIIKDGSGARSLFNYFGTGNQSRIQSRDSTINNRIFGIRDTDFPGYRLTLTGTKKNADSRDSQNIDTAKCVTDVTQNWWSNAYSKTTLVPSPDKDWTKIIGRALIEEDKKINFTIYRPEARACPLKGESQIIVISDGCGGSTQYDLGEGLATAPVSDGRGNIYVGVSNLAKGSKIGGDGTDNITRLGTGTESSKGVDWKSWQEITY